MPEPTRLEHEPKIIWQYRQLEGQIAVACENKYVGLCEYTDLPDQVSIGDPARGGLTTMLTASIEARRQTDRDPQHHEHGKLFYYNPATHELDTEELLTRGEEKSVVMQQSTGIPAELIPQLMQDERFAELNSQFFESEEGALFFEDEMKAMAFLNEVERHQMKAIGGTHAHPIPWPISTTDIISHAAHREYISIVSISQREITAIISTHQTTELAKDQIKELSIKYEEQIQARLFQLLQDQNVARRVMSNPTEYQTFVGRVREAMTRTLAKKFNLGYYRGDEDGILTRVRSPQGQ